MKKTILTILLLLITHSAYGLPVEFGRPLEPMRYKEIKSKNFILYHDAQAPYEARSLVHALEAGKSPLESWLGVRRQSYLPVVVSATTGGLSFANFITDAVELQTYGQGGRDLAWHEQTHSTMYRHLDNIFGPAGSILHLPWMPVWWIEGLPEALAVSHGSAVQARIESWYALTDSWPTYDRLHSLYRQSGFAFLGYGVSGSFVAYLLRTYDADKLGIFLQDFYDYSKPWWWPLTVVPFADFMPMDQALRNWTGKSGEELYEEYKQAAQRFWLHQTPKKDIAFLKKIGNERGVGSTYSLINQNQKLYQIYKSTQGFESSEVKLSGSQLKFGSSTNLPDQDLHPARYIGKDRAVYMTSQIQDDRSFIYTVWQSSRPGQLGKKIFRQKNVITRFFAGKSQLFWLESDYEWNKLCFVSWTKGNRAKKCPIKARQPTSLTFLGQETQGDLTRRIWLRQTTETLAGDRHEIISFDLESLQAKPFELSEDGKPLSLAFPRGVPHLLVSGLRGDHIRRYGDQGDCQVQWDLPMATSHLFSLDHELVGTARLPSGNVLFSVHQSVAKGPCKSIGQHRSPLLYAQLASGAKLSQAIKFASPWQESNPKINQRVERLIAESKPLDQGPSDHFGPLREKEAQWRGRSLFVLPWIGADGQGNTFGFRSVPLMDEMQNETLHLVAVYGYESRFPDINLVLESTRYKTAMDFSLFNRQTYNGFIGSNLLYYRETGAEANFSRFFPTTGVGLQYGSKLAYFKPIIGPSAFQLEDQETSFSLGVSKTFSFEHFYWSNSINGMLVPEAVNRTWQYNKLAASTQVGVPISLLGWRSSTLRLGLSGSRTRGPARKFLKEIYRPLKTFVPGSGGGLNGSNFPLAGPGVLTSALTGDTKARANVSWTFPMIPDLDTLLGIFYLQRLDFTAFFNYGGAWSGTFQPPHRDRLVQAHGYNVDLSTDIKGVTVNLGGGVGQVIGYDWELYFSFGFDTLIDIES